MGIIEEIKSRIDIDALIESDLGPAIKGKWLCPFHEDHTPSLSTKNGRFKCFGCGENGDCFDYVMLRHNINLKEAQKMLGGDINNIPKRPRPKVQTQKENIDDPPGPEWQVKAGKVVEATEQCLWSTRGERARKWLNNRGLKDETIKLWCLGYQPNDGDISGLWVKAGITIPCIVEGKIWYIKIRRATGKPKYIQVAGGNNHALFGAHCLSNHPVGVLTEGEFDQMLLHQECNGLVGAATFGGASGRITDKWIKYLLPLSRIFAAMDMDLAGEGAARDFLSRSERIKSIKTPLGKDITEFWQQRGDLRSWISFEIARDNMNDDQPRGESAQQEPMADIMDVDLDTILTEKYEARLNDICSRYQAGGLAWLKVNKPEHYSLIERDWDRLNTTWNQCIDGRAGVQDFELVLDGWHKAQLAGIEYFKAAAVSSEGSESCL